MAINEVAEVASTMLADKHFVHIGTLAIKFIERNDEAQAAQLAKGLIEFWI